MRAVHSMTGILNVNELYVEGGGQVGQLSLQNQPPSRVTDFDDREIVLARERSNPRQVLLRGSVLMAKFSAREVTSLMR